MIKSEKGITLVALVVMVIIITILATVTTYTGIKSYEKAQVIEFKKRMSIVEERVRTLQKRADVDPSLENRLSDFSENTRSSEANSLINELNLGNEYVFFSNDNMKSQLGIDDIKGSYLINFENGKVYSVEGVRYNGSTYYDSDITE